jgi:hypothetical protein
MTMITNFELGTCLVVRWELTYNFNEQILEMESSGRLRELGFNVNVMISESRKLVHGLDGKSLAQLLAIGSSTARIALMLHALIDGNKELAKALALRGAYGAASVAGKPPARLFLGAYKECCDLKNESFRLAIARLFFSHI